MKNIEILKSNKKKEHLWEVPTLKKKKKIKTKKTNDKITILVEHSSTNL